MPTRPKYLFSIKQPVAIHKVRHSFSKCWPSSDDPQDHRPEPEYLFLRERDESPYPISESELDLLIFNREFTTLSEGEAKSKTVRISPSGPRDKWAPVRKFWCERYDESPVPHSAASLKRFVKEVCDVWGERPEFPKIIPCPWTVRGWVKTRGVPGSRPLCVMDRHLPDSRKIASKLKTKIMNWAVAWFWSAEQRDRKDAHAKIVRVASFLNRRALLRDPRATKIKIPDYSTLCRHISDAESKTTWGAKHGEKPAYRRFNGVQPGLTATRLLEQVVIDDTRADQHLALAIDDITLEPVGRPTVQFGICVRTRALLSVTPTYEDPSLFTAMGGLKRIVLPKVDLIAERPDLRDTLAPHGKPGCVVWDRAWQQTGKSAQDALEDAHIDVTWADIEDPEFKAIGERVIGTFSRKLFHKAPGGIPYPPYILRKMGIDPSRTVVLTMSLLEERILDAWDDYQRQPHKGLAGMAPIEMWERDSQIHGIEILPDPEFLDSAFGEVFDVSITREGVRIDGTRYHDPLNTTLLLERLAPVTVGHGRRRTSIRARAKAKRNPATPTILNVWNHRDQEYVQLPAKDGYHLLGLNRQQRILYKNFAKAEGLPYNTDEDKARARLRVVEMLERDLPGRSIEAKRKQRQLLAPPPQHIIGTSVRVQTINPSPSGTNDLQIPTTYGNRAGDGKPSKGNRRGGKRATAKALKTRKANSWAKRTAEEAVARTQQLGGPVTGFRRPPNVISKPNSPPIVGATQKAFTLRTNAPDFLSHLESSGWGPGSSAVKRPSKGEKQ